MCGLVGMFTKYVATDAQLKLLRNMLYVDQLRGEHATGVAKINPATNAVTIHKRAQSATEYLVTEETKHFLDKDRCRIYLGHNRYATQGKRDDDNNAHPFQHKHITLVHNGSVDRWVQSKLDGYNDKDVVVDSHMVAITIAERGIEEAVKLFSGAFALVWWDANDRSLNFLRNSERPLYHAILKDGSLIWASQPEFMTFWVNQKNFTGAFEVEPFLMPVNEHLSYKFDAKGALQNGGAPVTASAVFTKVADPDPLPAAWDWNNRNSYSGGAYQRSSGANFANREHDRLLKKWKIDADIGDTIVVEVDRILSSTNGQSDRCNVYCTYDENVEVIAYYVPRALVEGAKRLEFKLHGIIEYGVALGGGSTKYLPRLQVESATAKRVFTSGAKKVAYVGQFPLVVNGHIFENRREFKEFAGKGCACCGQVPTPYNALNKDMMVYPVSSITDGLEHSEYICGGCMNDDTVANLQ